VPFYQSQRLKVGGSAARWVFVVTTILDSFQMCCLVKIAHYANEPRQESVARQVPLWELKLRCTCRRFRADDGHPGSYPLVRKRLAGQEIDDSCCLTGGGLRMTRKKSGPGGRALVVTATGSSCTSPTSRTEREKWGTPHLSVMSGPQGLKPAFLAAPSGTAEAAPYPKPFMRPVLDMSSSRGW
jgi:hypothetical protein